MSVSFANGKVNSNTHLLNKHLDASGPMVGSLDIFSQILPTSQRAGCQVIHYTDEQTNSERLKSVALSQGAGEWWSEFLESGLMGPKPRCFVLYLVMPASCQFLKGWAGIVSPYVP